MKPHEQAVFRFGDFVLVPGERLLLRDGKPVALTGKAFDLLVALVRQAGHLLTKDELLQAVWPGVVVEEVNLSVNVSALRKVLGAAPEGEWIETVPRQGYRFHAAVEVGDSATAAEPAPLREDPVSARVADGLRFEDAVPGRFAPEGRLAARRPLGGGAHGLGGYRWLATAEAAPYPSVAVLPFSRRRRAKRLSRRRHRRRR